MSSAIVFLLCIYLASSAPAADVVEKLADHMAAAVKNDSFSGAVLVMQDGQPLLRSGYGKANYEWDIPNTPDTKFRLGSITKQFSAVAVLLLAERGKLSIDDHVGKHVENAPSAWEKVTIRHLLNHTSGIPSYTGFPQMMSRTVRTPVTLDEVVATFRDKDLQFAPGEKFTYSNSGYVLLGQIIERASGQDYATFLRQNVLQPLEMNDTGYDETAAIIPKRAAGYHRTLVILANAPYIDMVWPHAAGALYSTVDDLGKWDLALNAGKLLTAASYKTMYTPVHQNYACGWRVLDRDGHEEIGHGGGIHGFGTSIVRYPGDKLCVVVLSNVVPAPSDRLSRQLADIVLKQ